jgi:hypothetical protein
MGGFYKPRQYHGKKPMTRDQTRTRLQLLLYQSTDAAFARYTVPDLMRLYSNLPQREVAAELERAREKRGLA